MGELPLCAGSFDRHIPLPQGNHKSSYCRINCSLNTNKLSLFLFWNDAPIRRSFSTHPELHAVFGITAIQEFREEQESAAVTRWSELRISLSISANWDYCFHFFHRFFLFGWACIFENGKDGHS